MSETNWTPGPWTAARSDPAEGVDVYWICAGAGNSSTELGSMMGGYPHDKREANANLAAAAPELYEALVAFMKLAWESHHNNPAYDTARAALAKARGEQA